MANYKAVGNVHLNALHDVAGDDTQHRGKEVGSHQPHEVHEQLPRKRTLAEHHNACSGDAKSRYRVVFCRTVRWHARRGAGEARMSHHSPLSAVAMLRLCIPGM
jgi:hypothetical protein